MRVVRWPSHLKKQNLQTRHKGLHMLHAALLAKVLGSCCLCEYAGIRGWMSSGSNYVHEPK